MSTLPDAMPETGEAERTPAQRFADDLQAVADFYRANPHLESPTCVNMLACLFHASDAKAALAAYARAFGTCKKVVDGATFDLKKEFGSITILAYAPRISVCKRVAVERTVTVKVPTRTEIVTKTEEVPVEFEERTETVTDYEWECPESLLAETAGAA